MAGKAKAEKGLEVHHFTQLVKEKGKQRNTDTCPEGTEEGDSEKLGD